MSQAAPRMKALTPEQLRGMVEGLAGMQIPGPDVEVTDLPEQRVRVYRPHGGTNLPVLLFMHGGGFVAGSVNAVDSTCRTFAERFNAVIVSVDYRLAPEHPFPAATDDVHAALLWARNTIGTYGGDPDRIAVMGESAGPNLAAVESLRANEAGIHLIAQVLISRCGQLQAPRP